MTNDRHGQGRAGTPEAGHGHQAGFWVQPEEAETGGDGLAFQPAFYEVDRLPGFDPLPGIRMNVMVGGQVMVNWVRIAAGGTVPVHAHMHEQVGFVLEGEIQMTIAGETRALTPGHAYTIPGNCPHAAVAGPNGCLVIDIFSPPREDYVAAAT